MQTAAVDWGLHSKLYYQNTVTVLLPLAIYSDLQIYNILDLNTRGNFGSNIKLVSFTPPTITTMQSMQGEIVNKSVESLTNYHNLCLTFGYLQ